MRIHLPKRSTVVASDSAAYHFRLQDELCGHIAAIQKGGGVERQNREHRRGKLTARERIRALQDPNSVFLELSSLAGFELYDSLDAPCGGIVTGVILVAGRLCMVVANDQTVKGGAYLPITVKKHLRAQEIALKNRLPCLYLVDSGGAYLPKQEELFADKDHFGRIFYNQARMSAQGIAQIASVHGHCTAGGAYIPAMSDYSVMCKEHGRIFLAGPPLVKAATGEEVSSMDLGGWKVHSQDSGVVDAVAATEYEALDMLKNHVRSLGGGCDDGLDDSSSRASLAQIEDLYEIMPTTIYQRFDPRLIVACIVDGSEFDEFKPDYGPNIVTGWARIMGMLVGIVANHGVLISPSAQKATHFIHQCTQRHCPLIFIQNITGFMVGKEAERSGIAKYGAMMVRAVATAEVPKITLIIGGSYGAGNYAMCGRSYGGDYVFGWPQSKIGVMGSEQAYSVMQTIRGGGDGSHHLDSVESFKSAYEKNSSPYYATARLWDDGLIDPRQTRNTLAAALASTLHKPPKPSLQGPMRL